MFEETTVEAQKLAMLPADIQRQGLKPMTVQVLTAALERGTISTSEIARFIPKETARNRETMTTVIAQLTQLFKSRNVRLIADNEVLAHRLQYPVQQVKRPDLKKVVRPRETAIHKDLPVEIKELQSFSEDRELEALALYMAEVRQFALLSPEQEAELGRRVLEENDLDARNQLVEHNLRLVRWVAQKYTWSGIDLEDLIQQGNIGLMTAASKYDYRASRFTTYAVWWVRQAIGRFIHDNGTSIIRLPVHLQEIKHKILKAGRDLAKETGINPTTAEIASRINLPVQKVELVLLRMQVETCSLDEPYGEEDDNRTIGGMIEDLQAMTPEVYIDAVRELKAARKRFATAVQAVTSGLEISERDVRIFNQFYGLDGTGVRRTLEAVAEMQNPQITRERVRQLLAKIWQKIDECGGEMDHERFLEEQERIDALAKIVGTVVNMENLDVLDEKEVPALVPAKKQLKELKTPQLSEPVPYTYSGPEVATTGKKFGALAGIVSSAHDLSPGELFARTRVKDVIWPRQVFTYLLRDELRQSLPTIATFLGQDHTTVLSNCRKVGELIESDPEVREVVEELRRRYRVQMPEEGVISQLDAPEPVFLVDDVDGM